MMLRTVKLSKQSHLLTTYKESEAIRQLKLSNLAQQHLKSIKEYTIRNFSIDRWLRYKGSLLKSLDLICDSPNIGRRCESLDLNGRYFPVGSHVVYYMIKDEEIVVVALLGKAQIPDEHLRELNS
jgi:toxin ParE1/3/4